MQTAGTVDLTKPPTFVPLDAFTVNLRRDEGYHYLQVVAVLRVADATMDATLKAFMPEIRHRINLLLSSKLPSEIATIEGRQALALDHHRTDQRGARLQADARRRRATGPQWPGAVRAVYLVHHPVRARRHGCGLSLPGRSGRPAAAASPGSRTNPPRTKPPPRGYRPYNLATQERIVRGRMPTMELINERFARYLRIGLFNYMHRNAEVSVGPIRVQKYAEFVRNLVVPTNLNLVTAKPCAAPGWWCSTPTSSFWSWTTCSAATGASTRASRAATSRRPSSASSRACSMWCSPSTPSAWAPVFKLEFEYVRSEMNSQFANIATPSEIVIATTFSLELGGAQADMHICFPYSMLEPIRDLLYSTMQSDHLTSDRRWIKLLSKQLQTAEVELRATSAPPACPCATSWTCAWAT